MKALEILRNENVFDEEYLSCNKHINIDEAIAELEALQSRSCESCKWEDVVSDDYKHRCDECVHNYSHYIDNWEGK